MANFKVKKGTQQAYNALSSKDENTVYFCTDTGNMYLGSNKLFEQDAFVSVSISGKTVTFTTHGGNGSAGSKTLSISDFATTAEVTSAISQAVASAYKYKGSCTYAELPTTGQTVGDTWNVTDAHGTYPAGTNYAWTGTDWDALGGTVDLSSYYTKSQTDTLLGNKVDKVSGKGLSTNDYTTTEKNKLSGISSGAQVNVIETVKVNGTALTPSSKAVNITVPTVNDATITIQKNGSSVGTFTTNAGSNKTVNITVPTKTSEITNDSGYITGVAWESF